MRGKHNESDFSGLQGSDEDFPSQESQTDSIPPSIQNSQETEQLEIKSQIFTEHIELIGKVPMVFYLP